MRVAIAAIAVFIFTAIASAKDVPVLQPGDLIAINVYELLAPGKDLAETRQIAADGTVRVPMLGPLKFAGLSPRQARDMLETALVEGHVIADPQVRVALRMPAAQAPKEAKAVKAGDQLLVRIWALVKPDKDYVGQLNVNADGEIHVPSVGQLKVEGQRADEIEKTLIARLAKILANADKLVRVDRLMNGMIPAFGGAHQPAAAADRGQ